MVEKRGRPWTRKELFIAINLYCKLPFGQMHQGNKSIISLAERIDRTPSSIALKLGNFASIDPSLDRKGASHCSKLDRQVWKEFFDDWEGSLEESENLFVLKGMSELEGKESFQLARIRRNQDLFRRVILASYDNSCCVTGLSVPGLLIASHIIPWAKNKENRMNPSNGLCLNALHDRAFDRGFMTFDEKQKVIFSTQLKRGKNNALLLDFEGEQLILPKKFAPSEEFLKYHRENVFVA